MRLASGIISNRLYVKEYITPMILYRSDGEKYVNEISIINTSEYTVIINLDVLYDVDPLNLIKTDYALAPGAKLPPLTNKLYLSEYHEIRCSVSIDNVVHFIINGGDTSNEASDPSINVSIGSDSDGTASGLTIISTPNSFTGRTFFNYYFDYDVSDLSFTDCIFQGVCYIKNVGGTITHTNSKGGLIFTNGDLIPKVKGYFGMDPSDF